MGTRPLYRAILFATDDSGAARFTNRPIRWCCHKHARYLHRRWDLWRFVNGHGTLTTRHDMLTFMENYSRRLVLTASWDLTVLRFSPTPRRAIIHCVNLIWECSWSSKRHEKLAVRNSCLSYTEPSNIGEGIYLYANCKGLLYFRLNQHLYANHLRIWWRLVPI